MNNKKIGNQFEREMCDILQSFGWWVHFITPSKTGSQPFDIIAVKDGEALAFDCKTSVNHIFPFSRLEDNQVYAFEHWLECGNEMPYIAVKFNDEVYMIEYEVLRNEKRIDLRNRKPVTDVWFQ